MRYLWVTYRNLTTPNQVKSFEVSYDQFI
jgi:hypothetical protein